MSTITKCVLYSRHEQMSDASQKDHFIGMNSIFCSISTSWNWTNSPFIYSFDDWKRNLCSALLMLLTYKDMTKMSKFHWNLLICLSDTMFHSSSTKDFEDWPVLTLVVMVFLFNTISQNQCVVKSALIHFMSSQYDEKNRKWNNQCSP